MGHAAKNWFRLSSKPSSTEIACSEDGLFVGDIPLLERGAESGNTYQWRPRAVTDLNADLSKRFGLPIDCESKIAGFSAVARALNRGDLALAQMAALHLRIPTPKPLTKSVHSTKEVVELAMRLHASGMLKSDWDPEKHPRWPAGTPDGIGGEFAPADDDTKTQDQNNIPDLSSLTPVQWEELPLPRELPFPPFDIAPRLPPNRDLRQPPKNPYPDRPECVEEWKAAEKFCRKLWEDGHMGKDGYRGFGNWMSQCILGHVPQDCGGNIVTA